MTKMDILTLTIDRVKYSNAQKARAAMQEVLALLDPLRKRGLRIRIARSYRTLVEDKAWKP